MFASRAAPSPSFGADPASVIILAKTNLNRPIRGVKRVPSAEFINRRDIPLEILYIVQSLEVMLFHPRFSGTGPAEMDMISMDEAIRVVLEHTQPIDAISVDLTDALGRVLAADVVSDVNMPPFDKSMMDGYAVVGEDVSRASAEGPAVLEVVEEIPAGHVPTKKISTGQAARIMTGAPIPEGANSVVMVEDTVDEPGGRHVKVLAPAATGENVAPLGQDLRRGEVAVGAGRTVRPPEVGMLASVGAARVPVYRRPAVAVISTGSEVVEPERVPEPGQIRNSNAYTMMAQVERAGAVSRYLGIVEDREADLVRVISEGLEACDIVLLSGGVSAGVYDLVQSAMQACGVAVRFDRIRMKPGKPLTFGVKGKQLVFGLPGNPVSAVVGLELLVRPAIRKMQKMEHVHRPVVRGILKAPFRQTPGRKQFVPAWCEMRDGVWEVRGVGHHGSADLFAFSRANSLFTVDADVALLDEGDAVDVTLLEDW